MKKKPFPISKRTLIVLSVVIFLFAAVLGSLATFWTEYEWFKHLGFGSVYITQLLAKVGTGVVFGVVALIFLLVHVAFIKRLSKPRKDWTIPTPEGDIDIKEIVSKVSTPVVLAAAVAAAAIMGVWAARHWEDMLKFFEQTPFHSIDPVLGKDIGFYLFTLPAMQFTQEWLVYLAGVGVLLPAAIYFLRGEIVMAGRLPEMSRAVRGHLLFSLALVLMVIGWGYRIEMFETLFSKRGIAYGATYTDVHANLIAYRIMIGTSAAVALFLLYAIKAHWKRKNADLLYPAIGLGVVVVLYALGTFVWPTFIQKVVVNPNEFAKEKPYIARAIEATRNAYGLDRIEVRQFAATENLSMKDIQNNGPTIDNIKIWDHRPLRATYQQLQVIRLYYDFPNISVDRYRIGGKYWQVMLSAREFVYSQLPKQSRTWVNRHLQYTHGYGACLSPVNKSVNEGLPDLWIKDIPPETPHPNLKITRPGIYYGLSTNDYILTQTTEKEFDYPKGKSNKYTTYAGKGGVGIGSFFRRMLFAIRFADTNLLFTGTLKEKSRILFNRDVQERVRTVAPFLMLDQEPYITVVKGRMKWIQDAYTISYRYPYSQPTPLGRRSRINYIRNSVKVVVDAYDGTVELYVWDMKDPMIQTYRRIFPDLFKDRSAAPKEILRHVRYPKDLFTIQAAMYESFHMTTPRVWYNQEDKWNIARELAEKTVRRVNNTTAGAQGRAPRASAPGRGLPVNASKITQQSRMAPYFMIMTLPNEPKEEFLLMVPFTPNNKDNMVAWMTARCDGENYGKLLVYTFPKKKLIFGPMQIEARIDQDGFISQWFTLRNQQGSAVIRGDLLVIPIGDAILYVEPIYLQSTQTKLPELKQVIVAFGQHLAMKPSLAASLKAVFGVTDAIAAAKAHGGKGTAATHPALGPVVGTVRSLMAKALRLYKEGQGKLKAGDWAGYGRAQAELKATLEGLAKSLGGKLSPKKAQAVPEAATTLAPAVKVPAAKTPAAKTPAVKTPAVKTPAVKTPAAKTPAAK